MNTTKLSQDPVDDPTNSAVFEPLDATLIQKLARADQSIHDSEAFSEPSDDESDRRYSDVSATSSRNQPTCPSPDTVERIRQWNLRLRDNHAHQHSPPAFQDRVRQPSTLRSFGQPASSSSNGLSPTVSRRWEESLPSGSRPFDERKRSAHASGQTFEPKRYELYGTASDNNPAYCSTPHFSLKPSKPQPARPIAPPEPQKKKMSSLWKFLSGKRRPKRERRTEEYPHRQSFQTSTEPPKEKKDWRVESFRRLRRSGRHPTNLEEVLQNPHQTPRRRQSVGSETRPHARSTTLATSTDNAVSFDHQQPSPVRMRNSDSPSMGILSGSGKHGSGERIGTQFDPKREASSFAAVRGRVMFMAEGSSVSSLSDREDESNVESSHLYLSRRQLRAMQYK